METIDMITNLETAKAKVDQAKKDYYEAIKAQGLFDPKKVTQDSWDRRIKVLETHRDFLKAEADKEFFKNVLKLRLEPLMGEN